MTSSKYLFVIVLTKGLGAIIFYGHENPCFAVPELA